MLHEHCVSAAQALSGGHRKGLEKKGGVVEISRTGMPHKRCRKKGGRFCGTGAVVAAPTLFLLRETPRIQDTAHVIKRL